MPKKGDAQYAKVTHILVYFDGPQLLELTTNKQNRMLAVAVNDPRGDDVFFGCEVRDKSWDRYIAGKADLHYVFQNAQRQQYYFFDLLKEKTGAVVDLIPATEEQARNPSYWPQVGVFSRSHTLSPEPSKQAPRGQKSYFIDGKWGAADFSQFYGKVADLYALFAAFGDEWKNLSEEIKQAVSEIIKSKAYRGGSSYLALYDQLFEKVTSFVVPALEVKEIRYASPGMLTLSGDISILSEIGNAVEIIDEEKDELWPLYRLIHGTLAQEKLLRERPGARFSSPKVQKLIRTKTDELAKKLGLEYSDVLYEVSGRKTLTYAKIVLSIYRRINEIYEFHEEGRVQPKRIFRSASL